jgi:hypothetical protein
MGVNWAPGVVRKNQELRECMFDHFVLRQPPIMQTTLSLFVVVQGAIERRVHTGGVSFTGCFADGTPLVHPLAENTDAASERASRQPGALPNLRPLRARVARSVGETQKIFTFVPPASQAQKSTMAPRRRWETKTAGDVR